MREYHAIVQNLAFLEGGMASSHLETQGRGEEQDEQHAKDGEDATDFYLVSLSQSRERSPEACSSSHKWFSGVVPWTYREGRV